MENTSDTRYLTIEEMLRVAEAHEGNYQLLKEGQLHYLAEIVGKKIGDTELFPTLLQKAAVYAHRIVTGHIFLDGNKRVGLTCALLFLVLNGCTLHPDLDDSIIELGFKIADGTITDREEIADHIGSWIQRQADESVKAIEHFSRAIELMPNLVEAHNERGLAYGEIGEYDRAIEDFNIAIRLEPDYAVAYSNRGNAYYQKGEYDHAIEDYNRAIEIRSDFAEPFTGRGVVWLHLSEWEKAKADLTTARDMGEDIIASFRKEYESVSDFEGKHGIQLPEDIAAMLTPQ